MKSIRYSSTCYAVHRTARISLQKIPVLSLSLRLDQLHFRGAVLLYDVIPSYLWLVSQDCCIEKNYVTSGVRVRLPWYRINT